MGWLARLPSAILLVFVVALGGCASTIKTYDSTFTSSVSAKSLSAQSAASTHSNASSKKAGRSRTKSIDKYKKSYFIEFRARSALTYGHALVVFGKLDKNGKVPVDAKGVLVPGMIEISGLHPASTSTIPWSIGHVIPVPAETGPSDGDFEDAYITARFRLNLNEEEFRRVIAVVSWHKERGILWSGPLKNCMNYINAIARDIGLKTPPVPVLYQPQSYVESLGTLNKGRGIIGS